MPDFTRPVHCLLGLPFDALSAGQAAGRLERARAEGKRCFLSTPNLNFVNAAQGDRKFRDSVCRSDLSVADGMPLIWISRLLGVPLRERISGSGLFETLRRHSREEWKVFFFGGPEGVGNQACAALALDGSSMRAAGNLQPGFGSVLQMSRDDWIEHINASGADFLVVSLGSAKGQAWISHNLARLRIPVVSHLGAVVNFVAGTVARAPRWMQRSGLEWLWRIKEEPHLWRRYATDGFGLLRLLVTRVLPLAFLQRLHAPREADFCNARVERPQGTDVAHASLHGAWRAASLGPVRAAFSELLALGGDVTLDLGGTTGIDSAFAGLMLLLDTALRDRGYRLHLVNTRASVSRLLALHGATPAS